MRIPLSVLLVLAALLAVFRLASSAEPIPLAQQHQRASRPSEAPSASMDGDRLARLCGMRPSTAPPTRHGAPPLRLRGTMVSTGGFSLATIDGPDGHASTLGEGSRVGEWVLHTIDHKSVELTHDDGERVVLEFGLVTLPPVGGHSSSVSIPRSQVDSVFPDIAPVVMRTTRVVPAPGGGFRLFFPSDSPLRAYQLEPGDILRTVDGQPLTPELALSFYGRARSVSHLILGLERQGQPVTLAVDIH